jgi:hypothetical protein
VHRVSVYLQGSVALGTTVKPLRRNEHDVDLVGHAAGAGGVPPTVLKKLIGDRLHENSHYRPLLEEMPRCWRLNYANEFHQDITPSVPNTLCANGGELVPDKAALGARVAASNGAVDGVGGSLAVSGPSSSSISMRAITEGRAALSGEIAGSTYRN